MAKIRVLFLINAALSQMCLVESFVDPDETRDAIGIIESRGFVGKTYYITTPDGYILALHRIINPKLANSALIKQPVLLQHGLVASSTDFIINCPGEGLDEPPINVTQGKNLGFVLSHLGYDVWLANARGNTYCRNHTSLNPDADKKFWEFSWDQHALVDLPATIDFVLGETGVKTLAYVGHSQGTLIMFALLAQQPQYNDLIKPFIALAPIATVTGIKSPIRYLAHNPVLVDFFRWRGGQFMPSTDYMKYLAERVCESRYIAICSNLLFLFAGFDVPQLNMTRIPVYYSHTPAGTSAWNMIHYAQGVLTGQLKMFDYGRYQNIKRYGNETPPEYHLEKITNRYIALMSGLNDWLSDPNDVLLLKQKLRVPLIYDYQVPQPAWNHLDFIWGKDAGTIINSRVVELLHKYA